ncbi:PEP/pyruvate-binding domain-containing protein [Micromonospora sp. NPDC051141]|uniref:PEP/pyruvate-binding domain-containing protein n=1 Tax=Micromonospora sp. NPDC051141 TaxID=3364284 RepID=UPI00379DE3FF
MPDLVPLDDLRGSDAGTAGAKAANLGDLLGAGLPVPAGFCLPISTYHAVVTPAVAPLLDRLTAVPAPEPGSATAAWEPMEQVAGALRAAIHDLDLPAGLRAELDRAYRRVCPDGGGVAVRSSGTSEDTADTSFAGQYHTELGVRSLDQLVDAVRTCWASLWEIPAIRYRERAGVPHADAAMAVVVQAMVPADAAGVMFVTPDPTAPGEPTEPIVIESSWGLGEAVVSGQVDPDRFVVSPTGDTVQRTEVGSKSRTVVPDGSGTVLVDTAPDRRSTASLRAEQVTELARLGLRVSRHFGAPQDVEWAVHDDRLWILQARPLTRSLALPPVTDWTSPIEGATWARISICDSWLPEPLSPLFETTLYPRLVDRWRRNWSGSDRLTGPLVPEPMAGSINGYAYLRLDFPLNRYPLRTIMLIVNFYRFHLSRLESHWRRVLLPHHLTRTAELGRLDLRHLETEEVRRVIDEVTDLSGVYWAMLGGLAWYWNVSELLLEKLYPALVRPVPAAPELAQLLQGHPTRTSEMEAALWRLAHTAGDEDAAERGLAALLAEYGHQVYQLDFVEPTPAEDPTALRAALAGNRAPDAPDPAQRLQTLAERRDTELARIDARLRRHPLRRQLLGLLLRLNRRYAAVRDEALFHFTQGWPIMRRGYLELGRRLVADGGLSSPEDVFYLTGDELAAELRADRPRTASWERTVADRRDLRARRRALIPPPAVPPDMRLSFAGINLKPVAFLGQEEKSGDPAERHGGIKGSPVSPGRVTAVARHVASVQDFPKLGTGEVLVASFITPAWSPLLSIAGAVVTDTGGTLSHGSIVAREYGIPAVMGTNHATRLIRDGQVVTVDGDRGLVY